MRVDPQKKKNAADDGGTCSEGRVHVQWEGSLGLHKFQTARIKERHKLGEFKKVGKDSCCMHSPISQVSPYKKSTLFVQTDLSPIECWRLFVFVYFLDS